MEKNYENITIKGDEFSGMCSVFDLSLQNLLKAMSKNGSEEGNITLKVDIQIEQVEATDDNGRLCLMDKPVLKHKVTTQVPVKDSIDGRTDTEKILVWDDKQKKFVFRRADIDGQMSIFDMDLGGAQQHEEPARITAEVPKLTAGDDEIEEAEYEEVGDVEEDSADSGEGNEFTIQDDINLDEYDYEQFEDTFTEE